MAEEDDQPLLSGAGFAMQRVAAAPAQDTGEGAFAHTRIEEVAQHQPPTAMSEIQEDMHKARLELAHNEMKRSRAFGKYVIKALGMKQAMALPAWMIGGEEAQRDLWVEKQNTTLRLVRGHLLINLETQNSLVEQYRTTLVRIEKETMEYLRATRRDDAMMGAKRVVDARNFVTRGEKQAMALNKKVSDTTEMLVGLQLMSTNARVVGVLADAWAGSEQMKAFSTNMQKASEQVAFTKGMFQKNLDDIIVQAEMESEVDARTSRTPAMAASPAATVMSAAERATLDAELERIQSMYSQPPVYAPTVAEPALL